MRLETLSIPQHRRLTLSLVAVAALAVSFFLLWTTEHLEGKWQVAILAALFIPWIAVLARDLKYFLFILYILFLPLRVDIHFGYNPEAAGSKGLGFSANDLILLGMYALWIWKLLTSRLDQQRIRWIPSLSLPFVLFFFWSALSSFRAPVPVLSFYELTGMLKTYLIFFYFANHLRSDRQLVGIGLAICFGVLTQSALAFAQYSGEMTFDLKILGETRHSLLIQEMGSTQIARVGGTLGHPNGLGAFLAHTLPFVLVLAMAGRRWWLTLLCTVTFLVGVTALILTFSRGAWMSLAVVLPLLVFLGSWKRWGFLKAAGCLAGFLLLATLALAPFAEPISYRLLEEDHGRAWSRVPLMEVAWNMIQAHPVLGVGLNNYTQVMQDYDNTLEKVTLHVPNPVHNVFLLTAAETGLPGLVFLLALLVMIFRKGWEGFQKQEGLRAFFCLSVFGSLGVLFLRSLATFSYLGSSAFLALAMGFVGALAYFNEPSETNR